MLMINFPLRYHPSNFIISRNLRNLAFKLELLENQIPAAQSDLFILFYYLFFIKCYIKTDILIHQNYFLFPIK